MGTRSFHQRLRSLIAGAIFLSLPAFGTTLDFVCVSNNSGICPGLVSQLDVEVTNPDTDEVAFKFNNFGPLASSITEIYWDDAAGVLLDFGVPKYTASGAGVEFNDDTVNPSDLPGGNGLIPSFTADFAVDSASGANKGINPGEWLQVLFVLQNTKTYDDVLTALEDGTLRIGMHVRSLGVDGNFSDAVVNIPFDPVPQGDIPEPSTYALMGVGLVALGVMRKRLKK